MKLLIVPALSLALIATASAQTSDTQAAEKKGAVLFKNNCVRCHGDKLEGTKKGPPLAEIHKKNHWTDERITNRILNGEGKMPPFRDSLSAEQIQQLIAYIRDESRPALPTASE